MTGPMWLVTTLFTITCVPAVLGLYKVARGPLYAGRHR